MCLIADITISNTTPASNTPITSVMNGEKVPIKSVVELAILAVKLLGKVIIFAGSILYYLLICLSYVLGTIPIRDTITKNAIPIPKRIVISGKLPARTLEVELAISVTIFVGIVIFYYLPLGISPIKRFMMKNARGIPIAT